MTAIVDTPPRLLSAIAGADHQLADSSRRFFDLGWDFASYRGISIPQTAPLSMLQGWEAGQRSRRTLPAACVFTKKWLSLRYNALTRNRTVDASVTPELLRRITLSVCPILVQPMTRATTGPLDWSVDRVFNSAGYCAANIAVISSKVNRIKGAMSLPEVLSAADAADLTSTSETLSRREWLRMASIMVGPHAAATQLTFCVPQATPLLPHLALAPSQILQDHIFRAAVSKQDHHTLGRLRSLCSPADLRRLHKMVQVLRHKHGRHLWAYDIWLEPGVFPRFHDWYHYLSDHQIQRATTSIGQDLSSCASEVRHWALISDGYALS